jgi:hypothetical protein
VPATVGVPEMVMSPPEKVPVTPVGKPENVAPVAPVVLYVIGVIAVSTQTVWLFVPGAEVRMMVLCRSHNDGACGRYISAAACQGHRVVESARYRRGA